MPHQRRQVLVVPKRRDTVLSIRGGGGEQSDSLVFTKIQNVIRSLLQVLERRLPILATLLKAFLGIIERILRIDLIPKKPILKTKKKTLRRKHGMKEEVQEMKRNTKSLNKHVTQKLSSKSPNYRIQKELREFIQHPPPNLKVKVGSNIRVWIVELTGAEGSIYEGETYRLRISFPPAYPTVPPSVYFLPPTPQHEHVYTNGDICLSLLGKGWQPQMTAQSIAVSILSILSSASTKSIPMDNARHAQNKPGQYQKDWVYHDDKC
jgi:ubiquitin-conjugating enzyme E2 W